MDRYDNLTPLEALGLLSEDYSNEHAVNLDEVMHHLSRLWREM